jgi:tricarballylate dehydrogenase
VLRIGGESAAAAVKGAFSAAKRFVQLFGRAGVTVKLAADCADNRRLGYSRERIMPDYDVIVVGAGNAALAASVSARNSGAERVLVLEKARQEMRGGNTHYSGGLLRIAFDKTEDILRLMPKASEIPGYAEGVEPYPRDAFWEDLRRMT